MDLKRSHEQIIDDITIDDLLAGGLRRRAREKAQALVTDFRAFIEANRDGLEAIQVLYSRPYREGLRFGQIKALSEALKNSPIRATPGRIWTGVRGDRARLVRGRGGKDLVDLIALVRHAIDPAEPAHPLCRRRGRAVSSVGRGPGPGGRRLHPRAAALARRHRQAYRQERPDRARTTSTMLRLTNLVGSGGCMTSSARSCL